MNAVPLTGRLYNKTNLYWRGRHVIYRMFDTDGALLYVGISSQIPERIAQHRRTSPWFADVARIVVKLLPNRRAALDAELTAIRTEAPTCNVRHGKDWIEPRTRRAPAESAA